MPDHWGLRQPSVVGADDGGGDDLATALGGRAEPRRSCVSPQIAVVISPRRPPASIRSASCVPLRLHMILRMRNLAHECARVGLRWRSCVASRPAGRRVPIAHRRGVSRRLRQAWTIPGPGSASEGRRRRRRGHSSSRAAWWTTGGPRAPRTHGSRSRNWIGAIS